MTNKNVALLYDPVILDHRPGQGHPERPERASAIIKTLQGTGFPSGGGNGGGSLWDRLTHLPVRPATREEILRVHAPSVVDRAERVSSQGGGPLDAGDTVASEGSYAAALTAAGAAIGAVDTVMASSSPGYPLSGGEGWGEVVGFGSAFAIVRPPGHHATPDQSMGFCIFNNVAVAAAHAIAAHGLERILLIDFDVHHGNGTQDIFYNDPRVLFFSSHQYPAYPGSGRIDETGDGPGRGFNLNVPIPAGIGDGGYARIIDTILRPAADRFKPELILVSAGYDAHWRNSMYVQGIDERVTIAGFYDIAKRIQAIAEDHCPGRLAAVLEGGYDLDGLAYGVDATLRAWLGEDPIDDPVGPSPRGADDGPAFESVLAKVRQVHGL